MHKVETSKPLPTQKRSDSRWWNWTQVLIFLIGATITLTALSQLFVPDWFYLNIGFFPPYNRHFIGDIGAFLLPQGIGLMIAARQPRRYLIFIWLVIVSNTVHVLNHTYDALLSGYTLQRWLTDTGSLALVPILLVIATLLGPRRRQPL